MREIVLDTETTGFDPYAGDRLIEIGCVELMNHVATGKTYHQFINPERDVPEDAVKVHGITTDFLKDKPVFKDIATEFLEFIGDSPLVIHNAAFDMKFLNAELSWAKFGTIPDEQAVDTLLIAKKLFPGSRVNLNELCRRFNIDNSKRTKHGALLDAELLSEVYLELLGGREPGFILGGAQKTSVLEAIGENNAAGKNEKPRRPARPAVVLPEEAENHEAFLKKLKNPIWLN